jgi:Protein of unknown function (DUF2000)
MDLNGQDAKRAPARFDTKIVVILQDELPVWKKLNVTAFVVSGIAATADGVVGARYVDGSGKSYLADVPPAGHGLRRKRRRAAAHVRPGV